ncbi:hypothetical protein GJ744_003195 [Endocarpon pusillum]|uniref:Uncharacterized protein n=1 Tax=Endocarpon pusillum TaxID=364733 RepID=A0A8H7E7B5_9EURO|nr:hypothetical protein GJ744_003195 [Endocarpon pusillum]
MTRKHSGKRLMIEVLVDKPLPIGLSNGQVEAHNPAHLLEENGNSRWRALSIMYGKKPTAMTRLFQLEKEHPDTTQNPQAKFVFIPMPTKDERYLWLELTWAVRGIYLPVCQQAMGAFKDWCKYLRLDFKARTLKYDIPYGLPYDQEALKKFNKLQKFEQDSASVKGAQAPTQAQLKKAHSSPNAGFWDAPSFFQWKFGKEDYESGERLYRTGIQYDKTYPDQVHGMLQYDQGGGWLFTGDDDTSNSGLYDAEKAQAGMVNPPTIKSDVAGKVADPDAMLRGFIHMNPSTEMGSGFHPDTVLRFDLEALYYLLSTPKCLRKPDPEAAENKKMPIKPIVDTFSLNYIVAFSGRDVGYKTDQDGQLDWKFSQGWQQYFYTENNGVDYVDVVKLHSGLNIQYTPVPPQSNDIRDMIQGILSAGLSLIPVYGPLIALAETMAYQAITDPSWFDEIKNTAGEPINAVVGSSPDIINSKTAKFLVKAIRRK